MEERLAKSKGIDINQPKYHYEMGILSDREILGSVEAESWLGVD